MAEQEIRVAQGLNQRSVRGEEVISLEADFAKDTWTFRINVTTKVRAGRYLLIHCDDLVPPSPTSEKS